MMSLRTRVVLAAAMVLTVSVLLTSVAMERAVRDMGESAREDRLLAQLYLLMAEAESENGRLVFPTELAESRLSLPGSGLSARVFDAAGRLVWQSPSALGVAEPSSMRLAPGQRRFDLRQAADGERFLSAGFGVSWATGDLPRRYTFAVAEDTSALERDVARFRTSLAGWLGAMAIVMLAGLVLSLSWGLIPLRRVAAEVAAVEDGVQHRIRGEYPAEIAGLTNNLNGLLGHERARQRRLDHALGDLAHSLKTPLAVMRAVVEDDLAVPEARSMLDQQLSRMDHIVEHQLQRARAGDRRTPMLGPPVQICRAAERVSGALQKVHHAKAVEMTLDVAESLHFDGVEGDLLEIIGNLLDNAFKWCRGRVRLSGSDRDRMLTLIVDDDGPGVPDDQVERLLARGARADESTPGYGIGLAVVRDLCDAYGGELLLRRSPLGGARCEVRLPR